MTDRRLPTTDQPANAADPQADAVGSLRHRHERPSAMAERHVRPHTREEAEERYIAARDAWTNAMHAAGSGRSRDLATLAMAQEAYEAALAERKRWASSPTVAIPIEVDRPTRIDVVVGQELSWRRVLEHEREQELAREQSRGLRGLVRRLTRR